VGTWTLSTIQSAPASAVGVSGSIVVFDAMTYTSQMTMSGATGTEKGTVTDKGGNVFTFTPGNGSAFDATMSGDGKTLSHTDGFWGPLVYAK
jgi:hypothetical protein